MKIVYMMTKKKCWTYQKMELLDRVAGSAYILPRGVFECDNCTLFDLWQYYMIIDQV